jgi:lysozyme
MMSAGPKAKALIRSFEGCKLKAYVDPASGGEPVTIGWGYTNPGKIKLDDTIPQWAADDLGDYAILKREIVLNDLLDGCDTDVAQFGAMLSLLYNIGSGNFADSSVLRFHRQGNWVGAAAAFHLWNKAAGTPMAGLTRRRKAEAELYRLYR